MEKELLHDIRHVSLSMFNKNFFGLYHGSISARVSMQSFVINKKETILDEVEESSLIRLDCQKKDYRWRSASDDAGIHEKLYQNISSAKYICCTMPPWATAYSLKHGKVLPLDYFGRKMVGEVLIYDPKNFDDWQERAPHEITRFFRRYDTHLLLIKGFGLISYDRDIIEMAKKVSILENSCRILSLSSFS